MPREPTMDDCFSAPNDAIFVRLAVAPPALNRYWIERSDGVKGIGSGNLSGSR